MKFIRLLLFPFAILYDLITSIRNFLFDKQIFKSTSFNVPIIVVGNLSVGGTGKTPQIEYLINLLQNTYKVAVLSRGYKRKTKGFLLVDQSHSVAEVGDEPLQFFKKFKNIQVAVDADRAHGIQQLLNQKNSPEVILLDDAFQHRKVKANFYILLTKYDDLYCDDLVLPSGNLRESKRGAKRANIIIVTKCPENLTEKQQEKIKNKLRVKSNQQVFFTTILYDTKLKGAQELVLDQLKSYQVVLVTGIANPKPLEQYLQSLQISYQPMRFSDHHYFSDKDIEAIKERYLKIEASRKIILTTEKDYVRLEKKLKNLSYIPIKTFFVDDKNMFDTAIKSFLKN
ncbi:tetraacyldisaccharide 4'-kinase [Tenacibaculum sp. UWU-22]|uniref:tetraacyldisaccharide 4'-kinase n=1 Tax=Tenacibaculum sp. UWU-22 TaxID=3234187 RepID=UPI0034DB107F